MSKNVVDMPLRLPGAPFELAQAQTCGQLVRAAYKLVDQWEEQDKPQAEELRWDPSKDAPGFSVDAVMWGDAREHALFEREQPYGFVAHRGDHVYVAFRGTESAADIVADLRVGHVDYAIPGAEGFGGVHDGFYALYTSLRDELLPAICGQKTISAVYVCGHSMGAALASLALPDLIFNAGLDLARVRVTQYTFGSPRVGSPTFASKVDGLAGACGWTNAMAYRLINSADLFGDAPPAILDRLLRADIQYQHHGQAIEYSVNYGSLGANHSFSSYLHAVDHPDSPQRPDRDHS